jgi:hypothetical protein
MRCYFHLVSYHDAIIDETGVEVMDLEVAEAEALKAIQDLWEEDPQADEDWHTWQLKVTDKDGHVFLSIPLDQAEQHRPIRTVRNGDIGLRPFGRRVRQTS